MDDTSDEDESSEVQIRKPRPKQIRTKVEWIETGTKRKAVNKKTFLFSSVSAKKRDTHEVVPFEPIQEIPSQPSFVKDDLYY